MDITEFESSGSDMYEFDLSHVQHLEQNVGKMWQTGRFGESTREELEDI